MTGTYYDSHKREHTAGEDERWLTVLRQQVIGSTDDELRDDTAKLLQLLLTLCLHIIGRVCVTATDDGELKVLAEVVLGAEEIGVCEVEQSKILREIVLQGESQHEGRILLQQGPAWMGVPERITLRLTFNPFRAWNVWDSMFGQQEAHEL